MRFVLGFDGGGTKTECVLMDEVRVVRAQGRSGPSNPMRVGFGGALAAVCEAGRMAMQSAGLSLRDISLVCAGLAGAAQPESEQKMKRLLAEEFPGVGVHVCTDLDLTLEATGDGPAIVLIAGTGSGAVGRDQAGHIARVGAHGFLLGDEGSAYDIGRRAVIRALRASDRGQPDSPLAAKILRELADEGDAGARELLRTAAADLAGLVKDLIERLGLDSQKFLLVKTGGMTGRSAYFDGQIDERLRAAAPGAVFGELAVSPAEAAARLALKLLPAVGKEGKQGGED